MRESITIGKVFGIPIKLHISFLLVLPFLAWAFGRNIIVLAEMVDVPVPGVAPYVLGLLLALALFGSVVLHELAHSVVAMRKGVVIKSISLMLFGGVAQMEELPAEPKDEAAIALAGPLFSMLFGVFLLAVSSILSQSGSPELLMLLTYLGYMNLFLAFFNLIPAFPTDGGRVLRALIAQRTSFLNATRIASTTGKVFAFLFGIWGLISGNFILIFIAFFIYIGASQEYQFTVIKNTLEGFKVEDLMTRDVSAVLEETTVEELLQKMLQERHSGYPVMAADQIKGCVTMEDIQKISPEEFKHRTVADIMSREIKSVTPKEELYHALQKLSREDVGRLMVMEGDRLVGIITRSDIMKGFRLRQLQNM